MTKVEIPLSKYFLSSLEKVVAYTKQQGLDFSLRSLNSAMSGLTQKVTVVLAKTGKFSPR